MTKQHSNAVEHAAPRQKHISVKHVSSRNKHKGTPLNNKVKVRGRKKIPGLPKDVVEPESPDGWTRGRNGGFSDKPGASRNNATVLSQTIYSGQAVKGLESAMAMYIYPLFKYTWQFWGQVWASMPNPWQTFMPFLKFYQQPQTTVNNARNHALGNLKSESWETETGYFYKVDLPGIEHGQLMLGFHKGAIMLRVEEMDNSKGYWQPHFIRRAFIPPVYIDAQGINARLQNGKLLINIPKAESPSSRQSRLIEIM